MKLYECMKVLVCSLHDDADNIYIVIQVFQWDTLALFLFIIYLDYVQKMSIDLVKYKEFRL